MEPTQPKVSSHLPGKRHVDRSSNLHAGRGGGACHRPNFLHRVAVVFLANILFLDVRLFAEPELHAELHEQRMCSGALPRRLLCRLPIPRAAGLALAGRTGAHIAAKRLDFARHLESRLAEDSRDGGLDE